MDQDPYPPHQLAALVTRRSAPGLARSRWTAAEDAVLRAEARLLLTVELAALLGRSESAVRQRRRELGVEPARRWELRHRRRQRDTAAGEPMLAGYRVERRDGASTAPLAVLDPTAPAHHASLAPFVSRLRLDGQSAGEVVLVDRASGTVVARRRLALRA